VLVMGDVGLVCRMQGFRTVVRGEVQRILRGRVVMGGANAP